MKAVVRGLLRKVFMSEQDEYPPENIQPPGRSKKRIGCISLVAVIGAGILITIIAGLAAGGKSSSPIVAGPSVSAVSGPASVPAAPAPSSPAPSSPAPTITYIVTGSPADVTYGASGSDTQGTVPMKVTAPLGDPSFYAINAQLQGSGSVHVEILIDGKVISQGTASGSYNIASAEIGQDPLTGDWEDDN